MNTKLCPSPASAAPARPARQTGKFILGPALTLAAWLALALAANAQTYSIDWFTIDGGGGTSTGGAYAVSGTIGQPDAGGPMTNGQHSVTGGFWALFAVQTPGAPILKITLTSTNTAMVYWPFPSTAFNLQQHTNLVTTNWVAVSETVTNNGVINYIIVNPPAGNRYYRLKK